MKKKSASQSAFFNPRVLISFVFCSIGVFLALLGFGGFPAQAQEEDEINVKSISALVPPGFDCSKIRELGIDQQENFRSGAIMIFCHEAKGGSASPSFEASNIVQKVLAPLFGATDVDVVTGTETSPSIIQSETYTTANPDNPNQVVVAYNDSRGAASSNFSGLSVSGDGGTTFTRVTTASGQSPFASTFGDPVILYNRATATWYTVWLDAGCGSQGIGGYKSTNPSNPTSWTHYCIHTGTQDDRESGWADNNPSSPFYGRMYVSWNDYARGSGLFLRYSTDNGATWTNEQQITTGTPFIRDVQITGDLATGDVYIAGMNENLGGFPHNDNNLIFRSTNGGGAWTNTYTGPAFAGPGVGAVGYFAVMFSDGGGYWRHEGWGEPAAFNHVVHLVYAQHGAGSDPGNVFYIRSTDSGVTFGAPLQLNTDSTTRPQWQPNISVSPTGTVMATWYDARDSVSCTKGNAAVPCYRMYSRKSNDNGATWLLDDTLSDVVSPLPGQADGNIQATYAGDYDYGSALLTKHLTSWTDGRVAISGASQQDVFTDKEQVGFGVTTTNPACASIISTQPTDFVVNVTDPVNPATLQAGDFTVNGIAANSVIYTAGTTTMTFHYNSTPVTVQGVQTMQIAAGAFNRASDSSPNLAFTCTFRYDALLLQVTTTVPAVGGTFSPSAPNNYQYDVNFNEAVDPTSVQASDLTVSGNSVPSVTAVSVINANTTARFTLHMNFGGSLTANIAAGAITDAFGNPNAAFSGSYTVAGCPPQDHYNITQIGGSIVAGTTNIGNNGDDVVTTVLLPFSYTLYDTSYSSITVSSNGNAQFVTTDTDFSNTCPPWTTHNYTIFPYWDDQCSGPCTGVTGTTYGIFTSTSGVSPNRIFNIEWRTAYYNSGGVGIPLNYELRLYEGQSRFDVLYGAAPQGNTSATAGVQKNDTTFDQYFCNGAGGAATGGQSYIIQSCVASTPTPSPTPGTPTPTATPSPIPTATATPTPVGTPTATPAFTPCAFSENFDGVTAPALPPGWVATNVQGPSPLWTTSTATPDTAPNNAFIDDPAAMSDKVLDTPGIVILSSTAQLSFRNNYALEPVGGGTFFFDGAVLEISSPNINGGTFTDITNVAVGGSFVTGGYNGTIATNFSNPIAGRMAWSQSSGGYINTVANLGPTVAGQTIKLRFRMCSDVSVAGTGWNVDTISLTGVACPGCGAPASWTVAANYPVVIEAPAVGTNGTFAYSAAGVVGGTASNGLYRYDPVANSWTTLASMPVSLYATRGVYAANTNSFYVFGGFDGTNSLNTTYRYNVATNAWSTGAVMPAARYFPNMVYYAATGKIYLIGGFDTSSLEASQTWEYDPVANIWNTSRANIPVAMAGSSASIAGQFVYLAGTWNSGSGSTLHYRYDIIANTWALMTPVPVAIYAPATGASGGKIYVTGGGNASRPGQGPEISPRGIRAAAPDVSYNSTYLYDIASNSWTTGPNTNVAHSFTGGTMIGNRLLVVGGYNGAADTNTVETSVVGSCPCPSSRVLVVYADTAVPTSLPAALAAEPGIGSVTLFNGGTATPTLAQLQQYDIVVPFSNANWIDQTTLGNNLGSYLAGGGIVVALNFDWAGGTASILGTWSTTYTPFTNPGTQNFTAGTLGTCTFAPLCTGVSSLNAFYRETLTLASGASLAGTWNDGSPMIAYKGRAVGISAYVGDSPDNYSGQFSRVIANAGVLLGTSCATPTPTPPPFVSISGTATYCSNPAIPPVPNVTMTLTGSASGSTLTNGSGNYTFSSLASGGNYTVTPTKAALLPGAAGINTVDVVAIQRHFLNLGSPLTGCRLTAADVNGVGGVNTVDVIAVQRFFLGQPTGIANTGKYQFAPISRPYTPLISNQTAQNYDTLVLGDVATGFVHRPDGSSQDALGNDMSGGEVPATVAAVALPEIAADQAKSNVIAAVKSSAIDGANKLVGFQGDFTFDERVVTFQSEPVRKAGITGGNWNVSGNVLDGPGPIRTLRISAYSNDFTPLSGEGTLFELRVARVSKSAQGTQLVWAAPPDGFIFIDADLNTQKPGAVAGVAAR